MEGELREARDRLQSMIEEYETALEELKSSNEELVSVNEELQSSNEELEASKEELQSVNEELHTVNIELSDKVEALDRANSDLQNLFESTDVATVFLDKNLVIRSFTPAVTNIFNIRRGDRGTPITDLSSRLSLVDLSADIAKVFAGHGPLERRVERDDRAAQYFVRLAAYRNSNRQTEGVVVTFLDITSLARAEARQRVLIAELQHRTRNMLTVVQFLAKQTLGKGGSLDSFVARLTALGHVQGLASEAIDARIDLEDLVRLEVQAIGVPADGKVTFSGPRVPLIYSFIQPLGLALHELATNAVKYGALKEEAGRLHISCEIRDDIRDMQIKGNIPGAPRFILNWRESGVAAPTPERSGFGRELIERALVFTLRAKTELSFGADGLSCRIEIPLPPLTPDDPILH
jgi:two-component system, chemotaxis family, CheB/CheR fusion protein